MDHIDNAGKKGYAILGIFVAILLIVILFIYIYRLNLQYLPG
jgi:hypothetical protein